MQKFTKNNEAIRKLTPEQYRVTQQSGTGRQEPANISITMNRGSTSTLCRASRCSLRPTSLNRDVGGPASPSLLNRPMSTN